MRGAEQADSAGQTRVDLEQDAGRIRAAPARTIL